MVTGAFSMLSGPLVGKLSDGWGKYKVFFSGFILMIAIVLIYTNLGPTPLWMVMVLNIIMFVGISSRMISSSALISAVPDAADRGAFMSINSSIQQISGGVAAYVAGLIVFQSTETSPLQNYDLLGLVVAASIIITMILIWFLDQYVTSRIRKQKLQKHPDQYYDLIVVGGGAAGFFGAINTAQLNPKIRILILEKTSKLLSKVKVSGGGRCNVTHECWDPIELSKHYPRGQRALKNIFYNFQSF